jgi:hypothetical protein
VRESDRPTFTAICQWSNGWWTVRVPAADDITTQVRFLDEAEPQARRAIALVRGVAEDSFDVEIEIIDDKVTP